MRAVLRVEACHDQARDHDKEANQHQDGGEQVFALIPSAGGEFEEARRWDDEDQRRGTQGALENRRDHPLVYTLLFKAIPIHL